VEQIARFHIFAGNERSVYRRTIDSLRVEYNIRQRVAVAVELVDTDRWVVDDWAEQAAWWLITQLGLVPGRPGTKPESMKARARILWPRAFGVECPV